jgi:hypothetical protein
MYTKIVFIITLFALFSCEKVIQVDLNKEDPQLVIEGTVNADSTIHTVKLTRSLNFDQDKSPELVSNAVVIISDDKGNSETLVEVTTGIYKTSALLGIEGRTYTLTVSLSGKTYTSKSTIPNRVKLDSLAVEVYPFGQDLVYSLVPRRYDPAGVSNYYRFRLFDNDTLLGGTYLQYDQFSDGQLTLEPVFDNKNSYKPGDVATLEMYCIDENVFRYFLTLSQNGTNSNQPSATPSNPTSLFTGDNCLGYFSAQTVEKKSIVIPNKTYK